MNNGMQPGPQAVSPETLHEKGVQLGQCTNAFWHFLKATTIQLQVTQLYPITNAIRQAAESSWPH